MENFRNHGPQDPGLYRCPEYIEFSEKIAPYVSDNPSVVTHREYLELSRKAVITKRAIPELRADIAYDMVCVGSRLPERHGQPPEEPTDAVKEIDDLFADLEVPDGHVVSEEAFGKKDFSEVDSKWREIERLVMEALQDGTS